VLELEQRPLLRYENCYGPGERARLVDWIGSQPGTRALAGFMAALAVIPRGVFRGMSLAELAASDDDAPQWLRTQLRRLPATDWFRPMIEVFTQTAMPDLWAEYVDWCDEQADAA
jgi:hypothetical protein